MDQTQQPAQEHTTSAAHLAWSSEGPNAAWLPRFSLMEPGGGGGGGGSAPPSTRLLLGVMPLMLAMGQQFLPWGSSPFVLQIQVAQAASALHAAQQAACEGTFSPAGLFGERAPPDMS
jgi:hypothetical protein